MVNWQGKENWCWAFQRQMDHHCFIMKDCEQFNYNIIKLSNCKYFWLLKDLNLGCSHLQLAAISLRLATLLETVSVKSHSIGSCTSQVSYPKVLVNSRFFLTWHDPLLLNKDLFGDGFVFALESVSKPKNKTVTYCSSPVLVVEWPWLGFFTLLSFYVSLPETHFLS